MWFSDLFLDYFPGYNKFRAVSMILVLAEFTIPFLAVLALDKLLKTKKTLDEPVKLPFVSKPSTVKVAFLISFGLTGGLALLYFLFPGLTNFFKTDESESIYSQITQGGNTPAIAQSFLDSLEIARKAIFKADVFRSFFLITLSAGVLWMYFKAKVDRIYIVLSIAFFILVDLWSVDKRYLNNDNFIAKAKAQVPFPESRADALILQDKDPDYRVLNISLSTFNDASTSYWHKSIGGYHGAKMKRYAELIDFQIDKCIQTITTTLKTQPSDSSIRAAFSGLGVLNMLNTRYLIYNPDAAPLQNRYALGNAWFVHNVRFVKDADSEITALSNFNPRHTVIVDERFRSDLDQFNPKSDTSAHIQLTSYKPNELKYQSNSAAEQLAVFSEIYYKDGWNAYVDGKLSPHFRANYVLRAMRVPPGNHEVVFKFEPAVYKTGERISYALSTLLLLTVCVSLVIEGRTKFTAKEKEV